MERKLSSKRLYEGRILSLRVVDVEVSRIGRKAVREVIEHRAAVAILPVDEIGRFLMVRQYRYPLNADLLEIPAGLMEKGEEPLQTAKRELREETGYSAAKWEILPPVYTAPGFSNEKLHLFCAEGLQWDPLKPDDDEDISLVRCTRDEAEALFKSEEPQDAKTLAALGWFFLFHSEKKA